MLEKLELFSETVEAFDLKFSVTGAYRVSTSTVEIDHISVGDSSILLAVDLQKILASHVYQHILASLKEKLLTGTYLYRGRLNTELIVGYLGKDITSVRTPDSNVDIKLLLRDSLINDIRGALKEWLEIGDNLPAEEP